jgi:hypothetical protein
MSLLIVLLIMLLTGFIGGLINWAMQSNPDDTATAVRPVERCVLIGIGATILIPLFLEIAQSKLLDNMRNSWCLTEAPASDCGASKPIAVAKPDKKNVKPVVKTDTARGGQKDPIEQAKNKADSIALAIKNVESKIDEAAKAKKDAENVPLKAYLLFGAYCLLAATAGPRFINGLLDGVLKDKQIAALAKDKKAIAAEKDKAVEEKEKVVEEKDKITEEKDEIEKVKTKLAAQNHLAAVQDQENALRGITKKTVTEMVSKSTIEEATTAKASFTFKPGPVIHNDDPQKERFGGKSENKGRALKATVGKESSDGFFDVTIWVESTDPKKPLEDVMFYLHDSFRPSVYLIKKEDFKQGKAIDEVEAYGAFTVGAVTDNGSTLLELDLSEQIEFPKAFRER